MSVGAVARLSQHLAAMDGPASGAARHLNGNAVIAQLLAPRFPAARAGCVPGLRAIAVCRTPSLAHV